MTLRSPPSGVLPQEVVLKFLQGLGKGRGEEGRRKEEREGGRGGRKERGKEEERVEERTRVL